MRFLVAILIFLHFAFPAPVAARETAGACLDSSRVRNWIVINDKTLLLDAGQKKYRMHLQQSCFNLSTSPVLEFKGDPITGRICSSSLDAIRVQAELCRISRIEEIDKQTFNEAQNRKKLRVKVVKSATDSKQ